MEGFGCFHPGEEQARGDLITVFWYLKVAMKWMTALSPRGATWRRQKAMGTSYTGAGFILMQEENGLQREQSLEEPPQGGGGVPITGGFQGAVGQGNLIQAPFSHQNLGPG